MLKPEDEQLRLERELRERSAEFDTLLNLIPVGIGVALDRDCRNIRINPAFAAMLDVPADANASMTAPASERPTNFRVLNSRGQEVPDAQLPMQIAAREGRPVLAEEFDIVRSDGKVIRLLEYAVPLFDAEGRPRGAVGAFVDISERREQEQRQQRVIDAERFARSEAERLGRMKDEFLLTLSHELRTPLNAVLGWGHALRAQLEQGTPPEPGLLRQALEAIERNARAQARLIDDLLDMSGIISGKVRLEPAPLHLPDILLSALESVRPAAEARGVALQPLAIGYPARVSGDPARLQQVFWNLLTNAVKFTPAGGTVEVVLERAGAHAEVSVVDTGQGIPPEYLGEVFERFRQLDASTARRHGGLGLGLSIARSLVEMHGGSVRVRSAGAGQGATFTVVLPLSKADALDVAAPGATQDADAAAGATDLRGVKVLLIDDQVDALALLAHVLRERGAATIPCASAQQALAQLSQAAPDVVISDIGMPDMDGYDFMRAMRALPDERARIPAIALTAYARAEDRDLALAVGYQLHLAKPVAAEALIAAVGRLMLRIP
jgi:signal transduction histidine kinase